MLDTGIISFGIGAGAALDGCVIAVHPVPAVGWVVGASEELALLALVRSVRPVNKQPHEHATIQWFTLDQAIRLDLAHPAYPQLCMSNTMTSTELPSRLTLIFDGA